MTTKIYRQVLSTKMYRQELSTKTCLQQRTRGSFCINNAQICPQYHCTQFSVLQRKNMCLGVVPGYSYILFNSLIKIWKIARYLFTYENQWCFLYAKILFLLLIRENVSRIWNTLKMWVAYVKITLISFFLRVIHYTIIKKIDYGICKQDYINYIPVISKLPICWIHSFML